MGLFDIFMSLIYYAKSSFSIQIFIAQKNKKKTIFIFQKQFIIYNTLYHSWGGGYMVYNIACVYSIRLFRVRTGYLSRVFSH